jgi:hypothetical protein
MEGLRGRTLVVAQEKVEQKGQGELIQLRLVQGETARAD